MIARLEPKVMPMMIRTVHSITEIEFGTKEELRSDAAEVELASDPRMDACFTSK